MKKKTSKLLKQVGTFALSFAMVATAVPFNVLPVEAYTSTVTQDGTQFTNPVINADVPDVDVIRVGDTYYMSSTTMYYAPGVPIMKSKDLVNWEICNYVYETLTENDRMNLSNSQEDLANQNGNAYSKGSWASSLRYFDGMFYCGFASYTTGKTYIYRTDDIENGAWEKSEFDGVYHDMSLYFDEETKKGYMVYGGTPINIIELNEDYTDVVKGTEQVLVDKLWPELDYNPLGEGAHIQKIDGKYYLFLITWPPELTTEDGEHVQGCRTQLCYTSDNLMGPYERHIVLNDQGAAQGQVVDTPEGDWYGLVFRDGGAIGRTPVLVPATWTTEGAENGIKYPILGDDKKMNTTVDMPLTGEPRTSIVTSDEFYNQASQDDAQGLELIENGGFESETAGWESREGATLSLAYSTIVSGRLGLKVSQRRATGAGATQDLTGKVKPGDKLDISAKLQYRYDESDAASENYPDTKRFIISIVYGDGYIENMVSTTATKGEWAEFKGSYTIPQDADTSSVKIFFETPWTPNPDASEDLMIYYLDDVSMTKEGSRFTSEDGSKLKLEWQWNHNPDDANWSLTERPGYLRIRTGRTDASILHARNTLTQRVFGPQSNAYVKLDASNMKDGDVAGLVGLQEHYAYIGVKKEEGKLYLVQSNTDSESGYGIDSWKDEKENARVELDQSEVLLRMAFDCTNTWNQNVSFYYSLDDGATWTKFGNTCTVTFELTHFVGTRFGLFNYATKEAGGYVDFDYFRVDTGSVQEGAVTVKEAAFAQNSAEISGSAGVEVDIPVSMEAVEGAKAIEAAFDIPDNMEVADVDFNEEHVSGECSYESGAEGLELKVQGGSVSHAGGEFAIIRLRVKEQVAGEQRVQLKADSIRAIGINTEYDVSDMVMDLALIGRSDVLTSGSTKTPGRANPLMDHKFGADPYAITYNGRIYVYMTNDSQEYDQTPKDENGYPVSSNTYGKINSINVISSDDMVNWVDHGSIPVAGPDGIAKWANNSWAPAACHKVVDGKDKFFLYFADSANGIGVLEADSPIGPFREPETGSRLISRGMQAAEGVTWLFDPAVLVDDDGTGYLYYGGGIPSDPAIGDANDPGTGRVVKLADNMVQVEGDAKVIDAPGLFEDSGIHKHNGRYYYTYCSNFSTTLPETGRGNICVMESDNPMGPFTFVGQAFSNPSNFFGIGGNNHHTFFEFEGKGYLVYHAQTVTKELGLPSNSQGYRSTHIDSFTYDEEGHIQPVTGTWEGPGQLKNLDPYQRVEAETLGWSNGITTADCQEAGGYVESINLKMTQINNGDWAAISSADFGEGAKSFKVSAAGLTGGTIEIRLDAKDGTKVGEVEIPAGDGNAYAEYSCDIMGAEGVHDVYFVYKSDQLTISQLFELDYWEFTEAEGSGDFQSQELAQWILFVESLSEGEYTSESWNALEAALETAKSVQADAQATKAEIDQAIAGLIAAFGDLEYGVQKQHLEEAIRAAEAILALEQDFEEDSLTALKNLIEAAKEMLADAEAAQDQVNQMVSNLIDAIVQVAPDEQLAALESLLGAVESLNGDKYTSESWAALTEAVDNANAVLADSNREEGALANAYLQLAEAIRGLVMRGNKAALSAVLEKAEAILADASSYTQSTISGLAEALEEAKAVYDNEDATQEEVDKAVEALTTVVVRARLKGDLNQDGEITTKDSAALLRYNAELDDLKAEAMESADVNGDGIADTKDAVRILQYASEKIQQF